MSVLVLVIDDEPDVEALFRQQFRHDLRAQRFIMDFAGSAADALTRIASPIEQNFVIAISSIQSATRRDRASGSTSISNLTSDRVVISTPFLRTAGWSCG